MCEFKCSGKVSSSCSTSGTCSANLVTNPFISHLWQNIMKRVTKSWWWLQKYRSDDFNLTTSNIWFSCFLATHFDGNHDGNHKLLNIVSTERYILHMQVLVECCYTYMERSHWKYRNNLFWRGFVLNQSLLWISRCRTGY